MTLLQYLVFAVGATTSPPAVQSHTLANGLTVLVAENHAVPLCTVEIAAKNGSMTEPPDYNGLSHLYEHMFFKANAVLPSQEEWLARQKELGLAWNGTTNTERVNYFFTTTSDHLVDTLVFMRDAIVTPAFDPKELERERVVVTGEINRNEAGPFYHLFRAINAKVWWKYPSRKHPLGARKTVLTATVAKMKTIQERYYVPNNSVLVVTGDVDAATVFAQAETLFAGWKRGADPFVKYPLVKHPAIKKSEVLVVEQKTVQTVTGQMVWHGPSTVGKDLDDTYAADAFLTAFAHPASRFQKALVDSGACVHAGMSWYTQANTGPITLGFEAAPDKVDACVTAVVAELGKLAEPDYVTADERTRAARTLEIALVRERERPSEYAHTLTFWWTSAGLDYYFTYVEKLYAVTDAQVAHFVSTWISGKPFVFAVMLSPELKAKGFDQKHFEALVGVGAGAKKGGGK
jgi:zinc protease